jgi:ketosteroid isomerase-like protein
VSMEAMAVVEQFTAGLAEGGEVRWDLIDPDIDIVDHDIPDADNYRGHAGLRKWLQDWGSAWESWEVEAGELIDADGFVVAVFTMVARGKGSGASTRRRNATVNTVRNGRVSRIDYYTTEEEALAAAGLAAGQEN